MKTLEEILAPLEELRKKASAGPWFGAISELIALRDELRTVRLCEYDRLRLNRILGVPPIANPKPAAEEPRT